MRHAITADGTLDIVIGVPDWIKRLWKSLATFVVDGGLQIYNNRLTGTGSDPKFIGWGTGAGSAVATSTSLSTERDVDLAGTSGTRTTGTSSVQTTTTTGDTYRVVGTRTMTATGPVTVTNAGLFDNATIASGSLFMLGDSLSIALSLNDSIQFTFESLLAN